MQRDANGNVVELGRVDIDRLIHTRIAENAKAMEGGGLMLPLKEATRHKTGGQSRSRQAGPGFDGMDDDDDIDEDAINSDLDDSDDDRDDDEVDDEGLGHIMLCMYDKVQRVKNKWYVAHANSSIATGYRSSTDNIILGSVCSRMVFSQ
jgi:transcription initiation factor TFIIA large subunit